MFKTTLKSVAIALSILAVIVMVLSAVDATRTVSTNDNVSLKVTVVDLDCMPVHNAMVSVQGQSFFTDNKGNSPTVTLSGISNSYDSAITDWGTVTVSVTKEGFVPTFVFQCVVYLDSCRKLTVKIYPVDNSDLPYVSYVESPPADYVQQLLKNP